MPARDTSINRLTVLIPVYNEADGLDALLARLKPVLEETSTDWTILFIDDGSGDRTAGRLRALRAEDRHIPAMSFSRNFGKEIAIAAGLQEAGGDAVVIMDADLQHPREVMRRFIAKWREGFENIYRQRLDQKVDGPIRSIFSRAFYLLYNALVDADIHKGAGDFRLLDRRAIAAMNQINETSRFNKGLFSRIGFKSTGVSYAVADRASGATKWRFSRLLSFALDGITSFTTLPLRIWSTIGAIVSLFAIGYAAIFLIGTLIFGAALPGFPTLIVSVMLFSGIQLISLGVIGEYLGRVYEEVKARPLYIVSETIGLPPPEHRASASGAKTASVVPVASRIGAPSGLAQRKEDQAKHHGS